MSRLCPCTSGLVIDKCCAPYLKGQRLPETAQALMRSRFTAYAESRVDYLIQTTAEAKRQEIDPEELRRYCINIRCISLKVLKTELGGKNDETGTVLFHASLQMNKRRVLHRELSEFIKEDGKWMYVSGETNE
ncbi:MAG: YchJ family metal-binding protein [Holophagaceae bacterium]|nr:YchJ family metal-binding protein [Holophagaceae bacterium]